MGECTKKYVVYVAGKYSDSDVLSVLHNIRKGVNWSFECLRSGFVPFCPWLDHQFVFCDHNQQLTVNHFREYSLEFVRRSDVLFVTPDWDNHEGVIGEINEAESLNIPVVYSFEDLLKWRDEQ